MDYGKLVGMKNVNETRKNEKHSLEYVFLHPKFIQLVPAGSKRAAFGGESEDRISALPRNVIERILELLPVKDAAKTSILSKTWRYIWSMLPNLVLGNLFCKKLIAKSEYAFKETVDKILLQHVGDIMKFDLDVSGAHLSSNTDVDRWIRYVTRNGVKQLTLNMSNNTTYKLPSYIFNCPTLTMLQLNNCIFKPPNSFLGFKNLITLHMKKVTLVPTTQLYVIKAPLLVNLIVWHCNGTQYLNIVSSRLKYVYVGEIRDYALDINCFMNCKSLGELTLDLGKKADCPKHDVKLTLEKLLFSLTVLEALSLGSSFLELLSAGTVPKGLPFTLNCLWYLRLRVDFAKVGQVSYALELIKSSPNLSTLEIWVQSSTSDNAEAAMNYLDSPSCLDRSLNKLKYVFICRCKGSKIELQFVKLLFARTPSLLKMSFKQSRVTGSSREERNNITTELMRFPRASPKAELFYLPSLP